MRRLVRRTGLALLLLASTASAQDTPVVPDVPTGEARLEVTVVHPERAGAGAGASVVLYALPEGGQPGLRRGVADESGKLVFEDIDADPTTTYLVGARYLGVSYPGARVQFEPGETGRAVEVPIYDVSPETSGVRVVGLELQIDWRGDVLFVSERWLFENARGSTVYVAADARDEHPPVVAWGLPERAGELSAAFGIVPEGLVQDERELAYFGPIFPGSQSLEIGYRLSAATGAAVLTRALPPGLPLRVLIAEDGPELDAELAPDEPIERQGTRYLTFAGETAPAPLALTVRVPAMRLDTEGAVGLSEVRIVSELDEAALQVREEHVIRVLGEGRVVGSGGRPLVRIPLPEGVEDLRFGTGGSEVGLIALPGVGLGVLGPLPAGETKVDVAYRVPVAQREAVTLERRFSHRIPLLSLYLADDGRHAIASERYHRRRPVRTGDRVYLHLEAFEIAPGEDVAATFERLPRQRPLSRAASAGLFGALALGLLVVLAAPLRGGDRDDEAPPAEAEAPEREALVTALRDLEHDYETGKVEGEAYEALREELRGRARAVLARQRAVPPEPGGPGA